MSIFFILLIAIGLAAANGANDNIKGAATLIGSGVIGYRPAIALATLATAAGGLVSIFLANGLLAVFSGKGIVPADLTGSLPFLAAVGLGAASTVWVATRAGLPVSTTHALLGGLLGAGVAADASHVSYTAAFGAMLLPLLVSPMIAILLAVVLVPQLRRTRATAACACLEPDVAFAGDEILIARAPITHLTLGDASQPACQPAPGRVVKTVATAPWLDRAHLVSAAAVSFARGLNDTPKIAALIVAAGTLGAGSATSVVIVAMAAGGWWASRRVADTLAFKVTRMDASDGLGGNLVTAALVVMASRFGLPVSTTHVSTGALFGIAVGNRGGHASVIRNIVLAWLVTLPLAGVAAGSAYLLIA